MRGRVAIIVAALMALTALEAWGARQPMDLLTALEGSDLPIRPIEDTGHVLRER